MPDTIDVLLIESDMADDAALRDFLRELQDTTTSVRPMPSRELAAILEPVPRGSRGHRRRALFTTVIVVGTVAVGATAAVASPEVRDTTQRAVQTVVGALLPPRSAVHRTGDSGSPDSGVVPKPSDTSSTGHPGPRDHPGSTTHPGPSDHPGDGGSKGNSGENSKSGTPHPNNGSSGEPDTSSHGGSSPKP